MKWYQVVLDYLRVFLSWPVIGLVIALMFRDELLKLPSRIDQVVWGRDNKIIFGNERSKKITHKLGTVAKQPSISKKRQEQLQKDIDNIFELGVAVGLDHRGKAITEISNVHLLKDQKGNVTGLQYNEQ